MVAKAKAAGYSEQEDEEEKNYMSQTLKRMGKMQTNQNQKMPKCTGGTYKGPVIATHMPEKTGNNCVITNDTHAKATNNGFARGDAGRFFCH